MNLRPMGKTLVFCVWLTLGATQAHAQAFDNTEELNALRDEMNSTASAVRGDIGAALEGMQQVGQIEASEQAVAVNDYFDQIEAAARSILTEVSSNSEFADQLQMMRSNITTLIATIEGEEPTPERDRNLARLTAAMDEYNAVYDQIQDAEKMIVQAIVENNDARSQVLRDIQIGAVERAVGRLQDVADGLVELVDVMDAITAVSVESPTDAIAQQ